MLAACFSGLAGIVGLAAGAPAQDAPDAGGGFASTALAGCETDLRTLNQIAGWPVRWPTDLESVRVASADQRRNALTTWKQAPAALDGARERLLRGLAGGAGAPRVVVRRVLDQIDRFLAEPAASSALWSPARRSGDPEFADAWHELVRGDLRPAIVRFRDYLDTAYLPATRGSPGLGAIPGGEDCFAAVTMGWTSLDLSPEEIDAKGRAVIAELETELLALAPAELGTNPAEILASLRRRPTEASGEALIAKSEAALARARASIGQWIGTSGDDTIVVAEMSAHLRPSFPAGFYRYPPAPGEPGEYVVNTRRPESRILMAEVVAFHEGVPGHHTFFVASRALGDGSGRFNAGLVEGWALYAERLAQEMGVYGATLDELGLVAKHLWAASRLVVEPGIHVGGWTRREALDFMMAHTALPRAEIELEVDRYIGLPGQSLSYMLGYLFLRDVRSAAEDRLGADFDVRGFHDAVLRGGSRPLAAVEADVRAWVRARASPHGM